MPKYIKYNPETKKTFEHYRLPGVSGDFDYNSNRCEILKALRKEAVQLRENAHDRAEVKRFQRLEKAVTLILTYIEGPIIPTFPVELAEELDFAAVNYALA